MAESYDLALIKGRSFYGESTVDVLQAVTDFAAEKEGYTILSVNLGYIPDDGTITAEVIYEG
ncbi:hypothetical protein HWB76_gp099 [Streptomyces phage Blueeyedbeauty]|uniref:Uncharacterized protein n=1 Tax=Streptomyces phage Blueeyedbeauty TaxID=2250336 RepID=A0A345L200_9CAUD|nr:hypothetical protein HWB76_gp099 [Streptomyces phage Blueeyedbeauty]AXH49302.1 hypothetical protein SEA_BLUEEYEDBEAUTY_194 [Streptomyces phage Blueeyedbeauty]QOI67561.1 hypothetical protein SEA_BEUFFERT_193 [Streptomyces phage Beuffert]